MQTMKIMIMHGREMNQLQSLIYVDKRFVYVFIVTECV